MKTFLTLTAALVLSASSVWAGAPCACGGTAQMATNAPTPAVAANTGDRRTYSYEPGSNVATTGMSGMRVYARANHSTVPSFMMQKSMRAGFVGR